MKKKYDLGIIGGKIFYKDRVVKNNIAIKKGKIFLIGDVKAAECKEILNAKNLITLPGIIDTQVHFREPGLTHKEDIFHGTKSALLGGITSIFEMPNTNPPTINKKALKSKINIAKKRSWTNFAFFIGASKSNIRDLQKLEKEDGCAGIKMFMGSSTGNLLVSEEELVEQVLKTCKRRVSIHSEDEDRLIRNFKRIDFTNGVSEHEKWRDPKSALISTKKVLKYAKKYNAKAHILHISSKEEMQVLRKKSQNVTVEVTPQHLSLYSPKCYLELGSLAQMNPPIRNKDHQNALWKGINDNIVNVIGSDHAPHTLQEKSKDWPSSPSGMPGVQTILPIMLNHVNKRKITLVKLVNLLSTQPAKIFGIKNKGLILKGYDADLTIIDLRKETLISNKKIVSKSRWTPFNNKRIKGTPIATIINGKLKMFRGKLLGRPNGRIIEFEK